MNFNILFHSKGTDCSISFFRNDWFSYEDYTLFVYNLKNFSDAHLVNLDEENILSICEKNIKVLMEKKTIDVNSAVCFEYSGDIDYRYNFIDAFEGFPKWW